MAMIVTEFGKFRYNCLPIGICTSVEIFQDKVDKILIDIEGVKTYIDDLLVLSKDSFEKHIYQLRKIFGRLRATGLKVNEPKYTFGLKYTPYLGYVMTKKVIRPDPKKVQGIMYLRQPSTNTEARVLIGMVQYYRDMCPNRSHILSPMSKAASVPKGRKYCVMRY